MPSLLFLTCLFMTDAGEIDPDDNGVEDCVERKQSSLTLTLRGRRGRMTLFMECEGEKPSDGSEVVNSVDGGGSWKPLRLKVDERRRLCIVVVVVDDEVVDVADTGPVEPDTTL